MHEKCKRIEIRIETRSKLKDLPDRVGFLDWLLLELG